VTVQRYATIIRAHIIPTLSDVPLQSLDGVKIDRAYAHLLKDGKRGGGGLSTMTLHHVHTLLGAIIKSAVKARKLVRSPLDDIETRPKPKAKRVEVLDDAEIAALLNSIKGTWLYMPVVLATYTGLRRGEVLGVRWQDIDFNKGTLTVAQAVERTGGKPSLKEPKTDKSRRTIKLPDPLLTALAAHRKAEAERRLAHGLGKTDLVFTSTRDGKLIYPDAFSHAFAGAGRRQHHQAGDVPRAEAYSHNAPTACRDSSAGGFGEGGP
jgi:integrase